MDGDCKKPRIDWFRLLIFIVPMGMGGIGGYYTLQAQANANSKSTVAQAATLEKHGERLNALERNEARDSARYDAIMNTLQRLERKIDNLEGGAKRQR